MSGPVRRAIALAGASAGVLAAGTAAGILAKRRHSGPPESELEGPALGSVRGVPHPVGTEDGLLLYAEVDEPRGEIEPGAPTVVFVHGFGLTLDSWHFQRLALRDTHRLVLYDQRSHGRSGRAPAEECTIDRLGEDLEIVLDELAHDGPIVLAGHSMGGMTVLALAQRHPEWFGTRIVGVCLVSTCADGMGDVTFGLPPRLAGVMNGVSPALLSTFARVPRLAERGRRLGAPYELAITRRLGFGGPVPRSYVEFAESMLASTPVDVVAAFYPEFARLDKADVLVAEDWPATTIICGDRDVLTPIALSRRMAEAVPHSRLIEVPDAGHLVMLEHHDVVSAALRDLVESVSGQ